MSDQQKQWATAMAKSKQQSRHQDRPVEVWEKQVIEEIKYFKTELKKAIDLKNKDKIDEILEKLFSLRAEQIKIFTKKMEDDFGFVDENELENEIKKYITDCKKLVNFTERIMNQ